MLRSEYDYITNLHKKITNISPGIFTKKFIRKAENCKNTIKRRRLTFENSRYSFIIYTYIYYFRLSY